MPSTNAEPSGASSSEDSGCGPSKSAMSSGSGGGEPSGQAPTAMGSSSSGGEAGGQQGPGHESHELRDPSMARSRDDPDAPKKPRACMGVLYFNQRRYDAGKAPLCGGFRKKLHESDGFNHLPPTDSVPGGDFKYICLGYSAFDEEALKRAAARRSSEADAVTLPYCEGLEIISAAALSRKPDLMAAGGPDVNPPAPSAGEPGAAEPGPRRRPGRSFVAGTPEMPEGMTFEKFRERFERMAGRIVEKMQSNGAFMVSHVKRTWQQVARELSGDRSGRDH